MSDLARERDEPEDLSALLRRGQASRADEAALQRLLTRDSQLRVTHQVGLDLDRDTSVRAGDEDLIMRAADLALARMTPAAAAPLRSWPKVAALLAALALSCTGVGAALWVAGVSPWQAPSQPAVQPAQAVRVERKAVVTAAPAVVTEAAPTPQVASAPARVRRSPRADAAELFHAANAARRAGELGRARRLYGELIRQDPTADEAQLAHVSLGKLLLAQGQLALAEREFRSYLSAGGGPLSEEALFHRAQTLSQLGRLAEEHKAWQALLAAYPDSLYAARARERLGASRQSNAP